VATVNYPEPPLIRRRGGDAGSSIASRATMCWTASESLGQQACTHNSGPMKTANSSFRWS